MYNNKSCIGHIYVNYNSYKYFEYLCSLLENVGFIENYEETI